MYLIILFLAIYIFAEMYLSPNDKGNMVDTTGFNYRKKDDGTLEIISYEYSGEKRIIIPDAIHGCYVTSIAPLAFSHCENLRDIDISSHIDTIGHHAFKGCKKLRIITCSDILTDKIDNDEYCQYIGLEQFCHTKKE